MSDPNTDVEARLRQVRDEIDDILDGGTARTVNGKTVGELSDMKGVVFGLASEDLADVRVTQEPSDPPAPLITLLGEMIDGMAAAYGHPPRAVAGHAIEMMERSKERDEYDREANVTNLEEDDG